MHQKTDVSLYSLECPHDKFTYHVDCNEAKRIITTYSTSLLNDLNITKKMKFLQDCKCKVLESNINAVECDIDKNPCQATRTIGQEMTDPLYRC